MPLANGGAEKHATAVAVPGAVTSQEVNSGEGPTRRSIPQAIGEALRRLLHRLD